jgi:hypothetical protein
MALRNRSGGMTLYTRNRIAFVLALVVIAGLIAFACGCGTTMLPGRDDYTVNRFLITIAEAVAFILLGRLM